MIAVLFVHAIVVSSLHIVHDVRREFKVDIFRNSCRVVHLSKCWSKLLAERSSITKEELNRGLGGVELLSRHRDGASKEHRAQEHLHVATALFHHVETSLSRHSSPVLHTPFVAKHCTRDSSYQLLLNKKNEKPNATPKYFAKKHGSSECTHFQDWITSGYSSTQPLRRTFAPSQLIC